jgi:hypothetical protein
VRAFQPLHFELKIEKRCVDAAMQQQMAARPFSEPAKEALSSTETSRRDWSWLAHNVTMQEEARRGRMALQWEWIVCLVCV